MYESHLKLNELPFNQVDNTRYFFPSNNHREVLSTLHIAVKTGEGFVKVVGDAGMGKTILCRKFITQLEEDCIAVYITQPCENPFQLLVTLAGEFAIPMQDETDEHQLTALLTKQFIEYLNAGKRIILCFDNAHYISPACFETLRLLTNFGAKNKKQPQVFLFGQPVLDAVLIHPSLARLQQQIVFQCRVEGLQKNEILPYLYHRLQSAGYRGKQIFNQQIIHWVHQLSGGIPHSINHIAHQALLFALRDGASQVLLKHVKQTMPQSVAAQSQWFDKLRELFLPVVQFKAWLYAPLILLLTGGVWLSAGLSTGTTAAMIQPDIRVASLQAASAIEKSTSASDGTGMLLSETKNGQRFAATQPQASVKYAGNASNSFQFVPARKPARSVDTQQWAEQEFKSAQALIQSGHSAMALEKCYTILDKTAQHDKTRLMLAGLLLKKGQHSAAESLLIEGIQLSLGQAEFAMQLSQLQQKRGDIDVALNTLQYSLPKAVGQADYYAQLGSLLQSQSRHAEAIKHYQTAVALSPENGQWLFALGISLQQEGFASEARTMFQRAQHSQDANKALLARADR